jgi:hypothetical protein
VAGKRFAIAADAQQAVTYRLQTFDTHFFYAGIEAFVPWWEKCSNVSGDYVKV